MKKTIFGLIYVHIYVFPIKSYIYTASYNKRQCSQQSDIHSKIKKKKTNFNHIKKHAIKLINFNYLLLYKVYIL